MPEYVDRIWEPPSEAGAILPRRDRVRVRFRAFIPDPIADLDVRTSPETGEAIEAAEEAIRRLDGRARQVASLEALSRLLLRAEGISSSRIEGLVVGHRQLAEALFDPERSRAVAREVVGNVRAISAAIDIGAGAAPFTPDVLLSIHGTLLGAGASGGGRFRTVQNWIGPATSVSPRTAEFIPPPEGEVPRLVSDLCAFLARRDVSPLAQAAIAHAQFETVHPFEDGNGRVGRALIHAVLQRRRLAESHVPPLSIVLAANPRSYIGGLTSFRAGDSEAWLGIAARTALVACRGTERFLAAVGDLQGAWVERAGLPRRDSSARRLIELLPGIPVLDVRLAAAELGVSFQAANEAVSRLEASGVLRRHEPDAQRDRRWSAPELFELLDSFQWVTSGPAVDLDGVGAHRPSPPGSHTGRRRVRNTVAGVEGQGVEL
jgi:Fic family protein